MRYAKNWISYDEFKQMLNSKNISEKYEVWLLLLYVPALRVSEAINVRVRDLHMEDESIDIWNGKGRDQTQMQKTTCAASVLKRILRYCEHSNLRPNDFVMFSRVSAQTCRSNVYLQVNRICKNAGIEKKIGTHTMRRSRAEHLLNLGMPLEVVSRQLRHRDISTTMHYLDISISDIHRHLTKINDPVRELL